MPNLNTFCLICKNDFKYLGSHLKKHNLKAKTYKELYGLQHNLKLISNDIKEKKQIAFNMEREKYLKNLDTETFKFKKGFSRFKEGFYFSNFEKDNLIKRINENTLKGLCPICNLEFRHLNSHLFNKHNLILKAKISDDKNTNTDGENNIKNKTDSFIKSELKNDFFDDKTEIHKTKHLNSSYTLKY